LLAPGSSQLVPTSIVGTPSVESGTPTVNVAGPVTMQPARGPYQASVSLSSTGGESCEAIDVPAGKRVWIENFSADALGSTEPQVYLRVDAATGGGTQFVRPVVLDLKPVAGSFGGSAQLLLHAGSPPPGPRSFTINACIFPASGTSAQARTFVSGWMENG
jgi:hypothetical protein